jgi:hypothetical protein
VIKKSRTSGCLLICVGQCVEFVGDIILRLKFIIRLLKVRPLELGRLKPQRGCLALKSPQPRNGFRESYRKERDHRDLV